MTEFKLKELLEIKNGKDCKHLSEGNIPVYGSGGLMKYVNKALYQGESILLPRKGSLANIQYVNETFWTVDTIYYSIVDKDKAEPYFLYYYLKQLDLSHLNTGTGVPSMTFGAYYDVPIKLPNLEAQKKITKVLSDLDSKIELNNKINTELESMAKLIYDYWFVQFDFPDENGKPYKSSGGLMVYNEALKREIPEGWEVSYFGDIVQQINDNIEPNEYPTLPYLPIDKLPTKRLYYDEYESRNEANSSLLRFKEDDILLGAMRVYFHRVCNAIEDGISRSTMMVLRPKDVLHKNYSLFTLNREEAIKYATKNSTGSSIPYAKWNNGLEKYKVCVTNDITLFEEFNKIVDPILNDFKVLSKQNQKLVELRDWLLPMLMNGQVRVGEVEENA